MRFWAEYSYWFGQYESKHTISAKSEEDLVQQLQFMAMRHGRIKVTRYEYQVRVWEGEFYLSKAATTA